MHLVTEHSQSRDPKSSDIAIVQDIYLDRSMHNGHTLEYCVTNVETSNWPKSSPGQSDCYLVALTNWVSSEKTRTRKAMPATIGTLLTFLQPWPGNQWTVNTELSSYSGSDPRRASCRMLAEWLAGDTPLLAASPSALGMQRPSRVQGCGPDILKKSHVHHGAIWLASCLSPYMAVLL